MSNVKGHVAVKTLPRQPSCEPNDKLVHRFKNFGFDSDWRNMLMTDYYSPPDFIGRLRGNKIINANQSMYNQLTLCGLTVNMCQLKLSLRMDE